MRPDSRLIIAILSFLLVGCGRDVPPVRVDALPEIYPDYRGVTVPCNISPLDFSFLGEGRCRLVVEAGGEEFRLKGRAGSLFRFPKRLWHKWMRGDSLVFTVQACRDGEWEEYEPFSMAVSREPIDPWLSYRLMFPGYEGWTYMRIYERCLESYEEKLVIANESVDMSCVNCHSYCNRDPGTMLFHSRKFLNGTLLMRNGVSEKLNTKTDSTMSPLVYPYWHPSGRWVAFSVNDTRLSFLKNIKRTERLEVYDTDSDVVVYDVAAHKVFWSPLTRAADRFETFPTFSPDGKWLYFCSAEAVDSLPESYAEVKYALVRIAFDPESGSFGDKLETVFDAPAMGKSVSFPRISPDGRWLAFTLHGWGTFSLWHKDADIWLLDLSGSASPAASSATSSSISAPSTASFASASSNESAVLRAGKPATTSPAPFASASSISVSSASTASTASEVLCNGRIARPATALNSDDVESYHCWSGNGRWLVFSSRRDDGLFTRLYISYVDSDGVAHKPFMLPQKDPKEYYEDLMYSYNIPELMTGPVPVSQKELAATLRTSGTDVRY